MVGPVSGSNHAKCVFTPEGATQVYGSARRRPVRLIHSRCRRPRPPIPPHPTSGSGDTRAMGVLAIVLAGSGWLWPAVGPIVAPYEAPAHLYGAGHRGLDIGAAPGSPVRAAHAGIVAYVGRVGGVPTLTVRAKGIVTSYQPVDASVAVGDAVSAGAVIGTLAADSDHCSCLHFGVREAGEYRDPREFLARMVVLKSPRMP